MFEPATRMARVREPSERTPVILALVVTAVSFPLGLLVGWLIWR